MPGTWAASQDAGSVRAVFTLVCDLSHRETYSPPLPLPCRIYNFAPEAQRTPGESAQTVCGCYSHHCC